MFLNIFYVCSLRFYLYFNATFPFPQVFSLSPFPLAREPTVTAWRGTTLGRDITNAISLIVPLRFVRRLRNNMAQSLVLYVKSDARYGRRLAAPIPSSKSHSPYLVFYSKKQASPNEKNLYLSFTASLYISSVFSLPTSADTSIINVLSGKWKLVMSALTHLNL